MSSFEEVRFNDNKIINYTTGGPAYKTSMVQTNGGKEQRNAVWSQPLAVFEFTDRLISETETHYIRDFFHAMQGMLIGFRFKDWSDYKDDGLGVIVGDGIGGGQLYKQYAMGSRSQKKKISKPVSGTVQVYINGTLTSCAIDYTTGVVSMPVTNKTVTAAVANGTTYATVTIASHGFSIGDKVSLGLAGGTWATANGYRTVTGVSTNTFTFAINASTFGTFTSGVASYYTQHGATWTGEFDLPVRFDADDVQFEFRGGVVTTYGVIDEGVFNIKALKLVELKL
jgi:uncharacterized protein (TIGR02217 family)